MKYKLVAFDVDGTLTRGNIWALLHSHMKLPEGWTKEKLEMFKRREINYEQWVGDDIELWKSKGANKKKLMEGIKHFTLVDGALELIQELKRKGYVLAIISGSISIILEQIFPDYDKYFDYIFINHILFDDDGNIIGHEATPYDNETKAEALKMIAEKEGLSLSECVFVGDNFNDVEVAKLAGLSIAFNCKCNELADTADVVVMHQDMRNLLDYIQ